MEADRQTRPPRWLDRLIYRFGPWIVRTHGATLRLRIEGLEVLEARLARGERVVLASFHQRMYPGIRAFARFRPAIMISESRDGERIARVAAALGWRPIRGSSSRGGVRALVALIREVAGGTVGGHIVDGPRGPAGRVKPGVVPLARRSGAILLPVFVSARRRIETRSWDRFHVPLPFTRVCVRIGPPVPVPPEESPEGDEHVRAELEKSLEDGCARLDLQLRGPGHGTRTVAGAGRRVLK